MMHPLLNPDSAGHYDKGSKTAIEELEQEATVGEQIGWCKGNIAKYEYRKKHKGELVKDELKIRTYSAYMELLLSLPSSTCALTVQQAYRKHGIKLEYKCTR